MSATTTAATATATAAAAAASGLGGGGEDHSRVGLDGERECDDVKKATKQRGTEKLR